MEWFRFTLFNSITLFVMVLTAAAAVRRFAWDLHSNWGLVYWAVALGYTFGFPRGLSVPLVICGTLCASAIRWSPWGAAVRWVELAVLALVMWRCLELLMGW